MQIIFLPRSICVSPNDKGNCFWRADVVLQIIHLLSVVGGFFFLFFFKDHLEEHLLILTWASENVLWKLCFYLYQCWLTLLQTLMFTVVQMVNIIQNQLIWAAGKPLNLVRGLCLEDAGKLLLWCLRHSVKSYSLVNIHDTKYVPCGWDKNNYRNSYQTRSF